jgi:hypothetical protein
MTSDPQPTLMWKTTPTEVSYQCERCAAWITGPRKPRALVPLVVEKLREKHLKTCPKREPREKPAIFTSISVLRMLADEKTQTRRLIDMGDDPGRAQLLALNGAEASFGDTIPDDPVPVYRRAPYGAVGDRVWVRERWRTHERPSDGVDGIQFQADATFRPIEPTREAADAWVDAHDNGKHGVRWRNPMFMPRWASRMLLEVTGLRVERLEQIDDADAIAEGVELIGRDPIKGARDWGWRGGETTFPTARAAYLAAFENLNPGTPRNPWVWVYTFKILERWPA